MKLIDIEILCYIGEQSEKRRHRWEMRKRRRLWGSKHIALEKMRRKELERPGDG